MNHPNPSSIKPLSELMKTGEIKKVKYQCIKILEPLDINYFPLSTLKLYLIDVDTTRDFQEFYDTLIEKSLNDFWDYDQEQNNSEFMANLCKSKKNLKTD